MHQQLLCLSRRLRYINRLATNPTIRSINDAEHSFNASVIAYALLEEYRSTGALTDAQCYHTLSRVVTHDIHESVTGDVLYPTKRYNDRINELITQLEESVDTSLFPNLKDMAVDPYHVLKSSDMAELMLYIAEEYDIGNRFPNLLQVWLFSWVMVWRFQRLTGSETLETILELGSGPFCKAKVYDYLIRDMGLSRVCWYVLKEQMKDTVTYSGLKGYMDSHPESWSKAVKHADSNKELSWYLPVQSIQMETYLACRAMSNAGKGLIMYHVGGPRDPVLEKRASKVILQDSL